MEKIGIGFMGAGGIAKAHAYALQALPYYYEEITDIQLVSVCSRRAESREVFAQKFGFRQAERIEDFTQNQDINAVFILGPNNIHFEHFQLALNMPQVKYIYLEKPVCSSQKEETAMREILSNLDGGVRIQIGFQFLQLSAIRSALNFWNSGVLGKPIHFDVKYYHGDYLKSSYRAKRKTRLTPAPDGGAMADLGSHGISLLTAFFGEELKISHAIQAGSFEDVPEDSDLFSSLSIYDPITGAAGQMSASRISSGTGDMIQLEVFAEKGALRFSTHQVDYFEYFLEETQEWSKKVLSSDYQPITSFPSRHVPAGWLRSMVHAHYLFLNNRDATSFVPDLSHGLAVQRLVRETATHLAKFRAERSNN